MDKFKKVAMKALPFILTGVGVAGTIGSTVLAAKEGPKYQKALEENKEMTTGQKIITAGKIFAPAIGCVIVSAACQIGALGLGLKAQANFAGAYIALQEAYKKYRKTNFKVNGKEADDAVMAKIAEECNADSSNEKTDICNSEVDTSSDESKTNSDGVRTDKDGEVLHKFHFVLTGSEFEASWKKVLEVEAMMNSFLMELGSCVVNDYLDMLDLPFDNDCGDQGWCEEMLQEDYAEKGLKFDYPEVPDSDGNKVIMIYPEVPPVNLEEWDYYYSHGYNAYLKRSNDICENLLKKGEQK